MTKKKIKEINFLSVINEIIRKKCTSYSSSKPYCFLDNPIEEWCNEDKLIFDIASEVEDKVKEEIFKVIQK